MKKKRIPAYIAIFVTVLFGLFLGGGCQSCGGNRYEPAQPKADMAIIYFYRPKSIVGAAVRYPVSVNGEQIGLLSRNGYLYKLVAPGFHNIDCDACKGDFTIDAEAKKSYYVQVVPPVVLDGTVNPIDLVLMQEEVGIEEISKARYCGD